MEKKIIEGQSFPNERDLYRADSLLLNNCRFAGKEDGESALKESSNVELHNCLLDLRYPLWHVHNAIIEGCVMTPNCRAALWYGDFIKISNTKMDGIKAIRECRHVELDNVTSSSPEFGWKSHDIAIKDCSIDSQYAFLEATNLEAEGLHFEGKYSFQYTEHLRLRNCHFKTKDAFWHSKDCVVEDSVVKGEYLGWYSEGLTLIRCHIKGTQPLCYCKDLRLIDCTMEDADLAFEYSEVQADVDSHIVSIKNPYKGKISCKSLGELIETADSVYPHLCQVEVEGKRADNR